MVFLLGGVLVAALAIAFVAQSFLSPQRRTRIIFGAAAAPSIVLIVTAAIAAAVDAQGVSWFRVVVSLAFSLCALLFAGLVGAIVGSELASLTRWLLHRRR